MEERSQPHARDRMRTSSPMPRARKGFQVGPANLPDGVHRRKGSYAARRPALGLADARQCRRSRGGSSIRQIPRSHMQNYSSASHFLPVILPEEQQIQDESLQVSRFTPNGGTMLMPLKLRAIQRTMHFRLRQTSIHDLVSTVDLASPSLSHSLVKLGKRSGGERKTRVDEQG